MILIIDNYDSFTYNLAQAVGSVQSDLAVRRSDSLTAREALEMRPTHVILSPGPGCPRDAGICEELIRQIGDVPLLGVCLGHQAVCEAFGAEITRCPRLMHGKASDIHIANGSAIFRGLAPVIRAGRYHSLIARRASLPDELLVIAEDDGGEVMAVKHRDREIYGVQFHPESILTPQGARIIENFLKIGGGAQ